MFPDLTFPIIFAFSGSRVGGEVVIVAYLYILFMFHEKKQQLNAEVLVSWSRFETCLETGLKN